MAVSPDPLNNPAMPNSQQLDPLAQLHDIRLPAPIESWPPAFGWWLLGLLALAAVAGLSYSLWRYWRRQRYRREANTELQTIYAAYQDSRDQQAYLRAYSDLLKRVALTHYPRHRVAALTGQAWVDFLDSTGRSLEFSMGAGQVLVQAPYQNQVEVQIDVAALQRLGSHWIKHHAALPAQESP
jgi:hypothetical protein